MVKTAVDWHGWEREAAEPEWQRSLHIGPYPERSQIALYEYRTDGDHRPLAYFRSPEAAAYALEFLDRLIGVRLGAPQMKTGDPWPTAGEAER